MDDPFLEGVGCVILDEFHERHIDSDLCIAMLREVASTVRDDLHLVVMSATIDAQAVARYLGDCPIISVPGRLFPVDTEFAPIATAHDRRALPNHIAMPSSATSSTPRPTMPATSSSSSPAWTRSAAAPRPSSRSPPRATSPSSPSTARSPSTPSPASWIPCPSARSSSPPTSPKPRSPSTACAPSSTPASPACPCTTSSAAWTASNSAASAAPRATQRTGRAGRTAPGRCIRLWSAAEDKNLKPFEAPEIHRVDLCSAILHVHQWGKSDPRTFGWFEPPPEHAIASAEQLLQMLGALRNGAITPIGQKLLEIPAHPRLARLMLAASERGLARQAATIAALLSEKDILLTITDFAQRPTRTTHGRSDLLYRLELLGHGREKQLRPPPPRPGHRPLLRPPGRPHPRRPPPQRPSSPPPWGGPGRGYSPGANAPEDDLLKLILLAYPDRLCRRRENNPDAATMVGGFGVKIDPSSIVVHPRLFVAIDARDDTRQKTSSTTREALARIISEVDESWLEELLPHMLSTTREVTMENGKAQARIITRFADLPIREQIDHHANPDDIAQALATEARRHARDILQSDKKAAQVLERLAFVRQHVPERNWPDFTEETLGEILARSCAGKRSLQQVKDQDLAELLLNELDWKLRRELDELAPETITVPTGNRIRLEYSGGKQPTLAVRLQEVFGWLATPRIAAGRVPLVMELLGPNFRPVQITSDLASFWKTTYFEVRKDLRIRYPKHAWPEDPLTAKPESKGRPRR